MLINSHRFFLFIFLIGGHSAKSGRSLVGPFRGLHRSLHLGLIHQEEAAQQV